MALTALGIAAAPANATAASTENIAAERAVLSKVIGAADRDATYAALSTADKALLAQAMTHQQATTLVSQTGTLSPARAAAAAGPAVAAAGGCWWHYQYDSWSDLGFTEGYTWMQLNWCSNGTSITSWSRSNTGGQGQDTFVWKGVVGSWSLNVGWEIRDAVEYRFVLPGNITFQPCMQIRGGRAGLYSTQKTCNLN
ncbi:MAG TPA: hypothetical protein VJT31_32815 [Rugosimonospora sp.]|nr:hypothetical protein [Rugosimonospora sp.]